MYSVKSRFAFQETERVMDLDGMGCGGEIGRCRGTIKNNQDILYEKIFLV